MTDTKDNSTSELDKEILILMARISLKKTELTDKLNKLAATDIKLMCVLEDMINDVLSLNSRAGFVEGILKERKKQIVTEKEEANQENKTAVNSEENLE